MNDVVRVAHNSGVSRAFLDEKGKNTMSEWKVSVEKIEIFPHPNADSLEIAKVGMFQLVVAKSNGYKTGDLVCFAPKRSILPEELRSHYVSESGASYLGGKNHDRVSSIRLRGELSEGVTIPLDWIRSHLFNEYGDQGVPDSLEDFEIGMDLSESLEISLYEPPVPLEMAGKVQKLDVVERYRTHDVESMVIYEKEFTPGEQVFACEKLHGSQCCILFENGNVHISSKGFLSKNQELLESPTNLYWQALHNSGLAEKVKEYSGFVQVFAEVFPAQGQQWNYGANKPTLRVFRLIVDGLEVPLYASKEDHPLSPLMVPIIYEGPFDIEKLRSLAKGKEQVSGKELHKREGIVISPVVPRNASEGFALYTKIVADNFKQSDDDIS